MVHGADAQEQFSGTKAVADAHKFDEARLAAWMAENVEG
ncbi:MAG: phosphotransferase family protein, partial [Pseudomonadota bacterium]